MTSYHCQLGARRHDYPELRTLLAKASPIRSGDQLAGIAAQSAEERVAAQMCLADVPLQAFLDAPVIPYEDDEVTRLILDGHDSRAFAPVRDLTVGALREWLLSYDTDALRLTEVARGITPEMAAAVAKLMRNQDLILVARKCRVVARFRNTLGLPGRLAIRLQPNHPSDDPQGIAASIVDGLLMGAGDAVIGINPASDSTDRVVDLLHMLDEVRTQWRTAKPGDAAALAKTIAQWQQTLWRFTQVGHIGKRDGPKAWQVPVTPLANAREMRLKIPAPSPGTNEVTLYLTTSDAGDGNTNDFAVWENPRFVTPGRPDLALRDVPSAVDALTKHRGEVFASAARCLAAASEVTSATDSNAVAQLARKHGVEPVILATWLDCLGIGAGEARIDSHITGPSESSQNYDFIKGWTGADALSVIANSSDQHVRVPGNMKPHSVAVHPSPKRRVIIGWRSPVTATLRVEGVVQHAHPECGNGVTWSLELRRGATRQPKGVDDDIHRDARAWQRR